MASPNGRPEDADNDEVEGYIRQRFAEYTGLSTEEVFEEGTTLATVLARSPQMTNSIDLMEAFARTANALNKDYGVRVRLPALPLDTSTTVLMELFLAEFDRQRKGTAA
jgi:hypothetical protein